MDEMMKQCTELMNRMGGMMGSMGGSMMGGMMGGNEMGGAVMAGGMGLASPWFWLGWVLVVAGLLAIVAGVVWVIRSLRTSSWRADMPLAMLQRRFAGGEITPQQFAAMKKQLSDQ